MGYQTALEKAGCEVIDFAEFGSYQGTWLAFVKYDGQKGIVEGAYGSCSGCDAFKAEFDFYEPPTTKDGKYYKDGYTWHGESECTEDEYNSLLDSYNKKLTDFGKAYLVGGLYDKSHYEGVLKKLKTDYWFDDETKEYCEWAISRDWE